MPLLFGILALVGSVPGAQSVTIDFSVSPEASNNFAEASFRCRLPSSAPLGILCLFAGTDSDNRGWEERKPWSEIADRHALVLITACLRGAGEPYTEAEGGSGAALLAAVDHFNKIDGRNRISKLPIFIWGHSAGAQFGYSFACWKPDRIGALLCIKSGPLMEPPPELRPTFPALFVIGERDQPGRIRETANAYAAGRKRGAPWCLAMQAGAGHGSDGTAQIVETFLEAFLDAPSSKSATRLWGSLAAPGTAPTSADRKADPTFSALASKRYAAIWREFSAPVKLDVLMSLPAEVPPPSIQWIASKPIPERTGSQLQSLDFVYTTTANVPNKSAAEPDAKSLRITDVSARNPPDGVSASVSKNEDGSWEVAGRMTLANLPLGPQTRMLSLSVKLSDGQTIENNIRLYTRIVGPVRTFPESIYFGVVPRQSEQKLALRIESDELISRCEIISSHPDFLQSAPIEPTPKKMISTTLELRAGNRVGERNGKLTVKVTTAPNDRQFTLSVPFYGFIKK